MRPRPWTCRIGPFASVMAVLCLSSAALAADPRPLDPLALVKLRAMSARLVAAGGYRLVAETTLDDVNRDGLRIQYSNHVDLSLRRPDRLVARVRGDLHNADVWYDGRTLTKLEAKDNSVSTLPFKGTVESVLDHLAERHGATFPLADFVVDDPYGSLTRNMVRGRYEGLRVVAGVSCHHLVFSNDRIDWQIWIKAGADPEPKKIVITYKTLPGHPQYSATFQSWEFNPTQPDSQFEPRIPQGHTRARFGFESSAGPVHSLYH